MADYHGFPAALFFPSGYVANLGLLSALSRRTDTVLYDELIHASLRDGLRLGQGRSFRFKHNDLKELRELLGKARPDGEVFVVTEAIFSMDGDQAPLAEISALCAEFGAKLIVDEAHSVGIYGLGGRGVVAAAGLQYTVFATVLTYGKAFGSHGAAVLGSAALREYLVNTCRPFIYSTAPAAAQWGAVRGAYARLEVDHAKLSDQLREVIAYYLGKLSTSSLQRYVKLPLPSHIQVLELGGNDLVMDAEAACRAGGYLVKGIRSPTVAAGRERLRICLHAFNTEGEIDGLFRTLESAIG